MTLSYKKLWRLLIDKDMEKYDLRQATKISSSTIAKLSKGRTVSTEVLLKICSSLKCDISDMMEFIPDDETI